ncbi:MAG: hypothetical protein ACREUQ_07105, partial [Burkholderiales bacterium]
PSRSSKIVSIAGVNNYETSSRLPKAVAAAVAVASLGIPVAMTQADLNIDEQVIVQIAGLGPSATTFIRPELGRTGKSQ